VPAHFEQATHMLGEEDLAEDLAYGNNVDRYVEKLSKYEQAGFSHVFIHQIGPDQVGFFRFCELMLRMALQTPPLHAVASARRIAADVIVRSFVRPRRASFDSCPRFEMNDGNFLQKCDAVHRLA
jgi:hypothetical protein